MERINKFEVEGDDVMNISLIQNEENALITMNNGDLHILNFKNKKLTLIKKNVAGDKDVRVVLVI